MTDYEAERLEAEEIADLRAQVAALTANGVSMHKAAAAERAAVVAWLRAMSPTEWQCAAMTRELLASLASDIERGDHHDARNVAGSDAHGARNVAERNHGTGDVWAAIIAELPEGAARDAAIARRDLGIARYGVPLGLRDLDTAQRDLREELLDAAAYGVELAALLTAADPDDVTADVVVFRAAEAYASATGLFYPKAIGRAVRKLARGVR